MKNNVVKSDIEDNNEITTYFVLGVEASGELLIF